jgi:8-oxo-dGTP diphosphatase
MAQIVLTDTALTVVAAAALARADGLILLQRRPLASQHGGLWEFPGGKREPGETLSACLARELMEELAISIDSADLSPAGWARVAHRDGELLLMLMVCRCWSGEPQAGAGAELRWVGVDQLLDFPMPPADIPLAEGLPHYL